MPPAQRPALARLVLTSGLVSPAEVDEAVRAALAEGGDESPDERLAGRLLKSGRINAWQLQQLRQGRTRFNLGDYWIVGSIGRGGMGEVFKARRGKSGDEVAVKVLPKAKSTPEAVAAFAHEVEILRRLDHPALVRAVDYGHDGNVHFLVTEFVPGVDLRKKIHSSGPLSIADAAAIIAQVAQGLAHAHQRGIVHRDVKPGNVMVSPDGRAKLLDLGLAGTLEGNVADPRRGKIVGTVDYLSPDQLRNPHDPQPAWDIYSLGCTLYYAVTGKPPFPGGTVAEKVRAHCRLLPPDPRVHNAELSEEFVNVLAELMAKNPAERTSSALEVVGRLATWSGVAAPPGTSKKAARPAWAWRGDMAASLAAEAAARPPEDYYWHAPGPERVAAPLAALVLAPAALCGATMLVWWALATYAHVGLVR